MRLEQCRQSSDLIDGGPQSLEPSSPPGFGSSCSVQCSCNTTQWRWHSPHLRRDGFRAAARPSIPSAKWSQYRSGQRSWGCPWTWCFTASPTYAERSVDFLWSTISSAVLLMFKTTLFFEHCFVRLWTSSTQHSCIVHKLEKVKTWDVKTQPDYSAKDQRWRCGLPHPHDQGVLLVRKSLTADLLTVIPNYVLVFILLPWRWGMEGRNLNENESVMLWQYYATLSELVRINSCYFKILLIMQRPFQTINVAIKVITSWAIMKPFFASPGTKYLRLPFDPLSS